MADFDLDLTPYVPAKAKIKVGKKTFVVDSVQPPEVCHRIGECSRSLFNNMQSKADTTADLTEVYQVGAEIFGVSEDEAREMGWGAFMRLFAFLARPLSDLALAMRL